MATHTPRSLLSRLAYGATHDPGLIERLCSMPYGDVDHEAEQLLLTHVRAAWDRGWQPIELHRQGHRGSTTRIAGRLVALVIAVEFASRRGTHVDPQLREQVEHLHLPRATGGDGWLTGFVAHERLDRAAAMRAVVDALHSMVTLPTLRPLPQTDSATADPVLDKVRALLAKAESTTFEAEAIAFTAKAQELMTKHAIDAAAVRGGTHAPQPGAPSVIRVFVDPPYSSAKAHLLAVVARSSRCRTVELGRGELAEVIGMPADLAAVELLFTSLLVQAQAALTRAPGSNRSYRSSFLYAYARRIGERLREINDAVMRDAEAEHGTSFLPALRSQSEQIDDFVDERYGKLREVRRTGVADPAGWASGRAAADRARLNAGDLGQAV